MKNVQDTFTRRKRGGFFFRVPRLFVGLSPKGSSDCDSVRSPTSPLDAQIFCRSPRSSYTDSTKVGLSIIDSLDDDDDCKVPCQVIHVFLPEEKSPSISDTAKSLPRNFSVYSPQCSKSLKEFSGNARCNSFDSQRLIRKPLEFLSVEEIEHSEDYTCIISHGPNPKTTHLYGDCVLSRFKKQNDDAEENRKEEGNIYRLDKNCDELGEFEI